MKYGTLVAVLLWGTAFLAAQEAEIPAAPPGAVQQWNEQLLESRAVLGATGENARDDYRIGAEDLVEVAVFEVPELSRTVRVSGPGKSRFPCSGRCR